MDQLSSELVSGEGKSLCSVMPKQVDRDDEIMLKVHRLGKLLKMVIVGQICSNNLGRLVMLAWTVLGMIGGKHSLNDA